MNEIITLAMGRPKSLALLLIGAVATPVALASSGERASAVSSVTAKTPSGRTVELTVRKGKGSAAAWCAKVVAITGERPLSVEGCGSAPERGLHGAFIADCTADELIAYGAVWPSVTVMQPRRGRRPIFAARASRPDGVRFAGYHYLIAVDLREPHPRLAARRAGRTVARVDLTRDAQQCDGLGVMGGF